MSACKVVKVRPWGPPVPRLAPSSHDPLELHRRCRSRCWGIAACVMLAGDLAYTGRTPSTCHRHSSPPCSTCYSSVPRSAAAFCSLSSSRDHAPSAPQVPRPSTAGTLSHIASPSTCLPITALRLESLPRRCHFSPGSSTHHCSLCGVNEKRL
jgi:hypothetical protein